MSDLSNWSYTAKATIWRYSGSDEYGKKQFHSPEMIMCDYGMETVSKLGNIGSGIVIKNSFWTEYDQATENEDYILLGEHTEPDPVKAGADKIRRIIHYADTFERTADDYALITAV